MRLEELRERWGGTIAAVAAQHGVRSVRVFGSTARGDGNTASDLDLLVTMEPGRSYLDLIGFAQDLEDRLGCRVDAHTEAELAANLRQCVLQEAVPL